jgi:hypothetical protein
MLQPSNCSASLQAGERKERHSPPRSQLQRSLNCHPDYSQGIQV